MDLNRLEQIFRETDYVRTSGTEAEKRAAEYLKSCCEELGVPAHLEAFRVPMGDIESASLTVDGKDIPCLGCSCCGSGEVEAELLYLPSLDKVSLSNARGKIVLLDRGGVRKFEYIDLLDAGVKGILFRCGNLNYPDRDIDQRDLREHVVDGKEKLLSVMIHASDAVELVRNSAKSARIRVSQKEYGGQSHNVIAEIPGEKDEFITLSAHYDSTSLSHGAYDNMSGCAGLLGVMDALKDKQLRYGLRFVFCGSEERGLLGSKAYVRDHADELAKTVLNINLDMIGSIMGRFIACASAEEKLVRYLSYMGAELGFPISAKTGVYSSDSTPFADSGVPAVSFARIAGGDVAPIHCRYDTADVLSMEQLEKDISFITEFTRRMACSAVCPVSREIPEDIKKKLDEYLGRKRAAE